MNSNDAGLADLARRAGIALEWTDAAKQARCVAPDALRPILQALGLPCAGAAEIAESRARLEAEAARLPTLVTADVGQPIVLDCAVGRNAVLVLEDGTQRPADAETSGPARSILPAVAHPGYHKLHIGDEVITLAVAPSHGVSIDTLPGRLFGLSIQLYGLRRAGDGGIGDAQSLGAFARLAARHGAHAIGLSPTHALFSAEPGKYSPYSPSSRLAFNPLFCDASLLFGTERIAAIVADMGLDSARARLESAAFIDWPEAAAQKLALLRRLFEDFWRSLQDRPNEPLPRDFLSFRQAGGEILETHARFEALHAEHRRLDPAHAGWRDWPAELRDPASPAVAAFAAAHAKEVGFHIFLQWLAERSLAAAQAEARRCGMHIGLIADLAVGMESGGSHAWSRQEDVLVGLNIGAPPDLFNATGQNWGLTTFSPQALLRRGFEPFLATLRTALRHAGGVRIDHAMGLKRLWLVPEGAAPSDGAYLAYPFEDLLRLIKLESFRHQAVVVGEDLGTVPEGFQDALADAGIAGMDVLWFTRDKDASQFSPPDTWRRAAVAMTSTHDLPTVAGWWRGTDIKLREDYGLIDDAAATRRERASDRKELWDRFRASGTVASNAPVPDATDAVVDAAIAFVAATPTPLVLLPLEDALGLEEQPNLPGTIDEQPNWRRRYAAPVEKLFDDPAVAARLTTLARR